MRKRFVSNDKGQRSAYVIRARALKTASIRNGIFFVTARKTEIQPGASLAMDRARYRPGWARFSRFLEALRIMLTIVTLGVAVIVAVPLAVLFSEPRVVIATRIEFTRLSYEGTLFYASCSFLEKKIANPFVTL